MYTLLLFLLYFSTTGYQFSSLYYLIDIYEVWKRNKAIWFTMLIVLAYLIALMEKANPHSLLNHFRTQCYQYLMVTQIQDNVETMIFLSLSTNSQCLHKCRRVSTYISQLNVVVNLNSFFFFSNSQGLNVFVLQPKLLLLMYTSFSLRSSFSSTYHQGSHLWLCYLSLDTSECIQLCIFWQKA